MWCGRPWSLRWLGLHLLLFEVARIALPGQDGDDCKDDESLHRGERVVLIATTAELQLGASRRMVIKVSRTAFMMDSLLCAVTACHANIVMAALFHTRNDSPRDASQTSSGSGGQQVGLAQQGSACALRVGSKYRNQAPNLGRSASFACRHSVILVVHLDARFDSATSHRLEQSVQHQDLNLS